MKTKERLAYMALGGFLVIAGMVLGQFMFSSVSAQAKAEDVVTFNKVTCRQLSVVNGVGTEVISLHSGWSEESGGWFVLRSSNGYRRITMNGEGPHSYMSLHSGKVRDVTSDGQPVLTDSKDHRITFYGRRSGGEIALGTANCDTTVDIDANTDDGSSGIVLKREDGSMALQMGASSYHTGDGVISLYNGKGEFSKDIH